MLRKLRRLVIKTRTLIEKRKVALCRMRGVVHEAGEVASHGHGGARVYLAVWVLTLFESHACKVETVRVSDCFGPVGEPGTRRRNRPAPG